MEYLVIFIGGVVVGSLVTLARCYRTRTEAVEQLRKELNLPEPMADSYKRAEADRAEYKAKSMWGPRSNGKP